MSRGSATDNCRACGPDDRGAFGADKRRGFAPWNRGTFGADRRRGCAAENGRGFAPDTSLRVAIFHSPLAVVRGEAAAFIRARQRSALVRRGAAAVAHGVTARARLTIARTSARSDSASNTI